MRQLRELRSFILGSFILGGVGITFVAEKKGGEKLLVVYLEIRSADSND